jgi:hypothetical protein
MGKNVPENAKDTNLKKDVTTAQHSGPVSVIKWNDKKYFTVISKCGCDEKGKPACALDYNLKDKILHPYLLE